MSDESYQKEPKYQKFQSATEKALKTFETSLQWTDQVSCLATLHKVLLAYTQYPVVPYKYQVNRRLSQCLHHKLPHGVHLKALDVYCAIFERIHSDGLSLDLHIYCSSLFPLMSFATIDVRTRLLEVYEKYMLPLGHKLVPALSGFVLGLLPGLEENSDHSERILAIIDRIWSEIGKAELLDALWQSIVLSPNYRVAALNLISTRLQQDGMKDELADKIDTALSRAALSATLSDKNTYTQRIALDIIVVIYPFSKVSQTFSDQHQTTLLCPVLCTLLRREQSLTRRVYSWLLGDNDNCNVEDQPQNSSEQCYFTAHVQTHVVSAVRKMLFDRDLLTCAKILSMLFQRTSIGDSIKEIIISDVAMSIYKQALDLGGFTVEEVVSLRSSGKGGKGAARKRPTSNDKAEVVRAAGLIFQTFDEDFVWDWFDIILKQSCDPSCCHDGKQESALTLSIALKLIILLVKLLPLEYHPTHIPQLLSSLLDMIYKHCSTTLQQGHLIESLNTVSELSSHLRDQSVQGCSAPPSRSDTPLLNRRSSSSPDDVANEIREKDQTTTNYANTSTPISKHREGMADAVKSYLKLFPKLIFDIVKLPCFDKSRTVVWKGNGDIIEIFKISCNLLKEFSFLTPPDYDVVVSSDIHTPLPDWLTGLLSCCVINNGVRHYGNPQHQLLMLQAVHLKCCLLEGSPCDLVTMEMKTHIAKETNFYQDVCSILYHCVRDVTLQTEASELLYKLHTLSGPVVVCELPILQAFSEHKDSVWPYQQFAVISQYRPVWNTGGYRPRPFLRAGLRMLEGLLSHTPTVQNFVQRWVLHMCGQGNVDLLISPLLVLLGECPIQRQQYKSPSSKETGTFYQLTALADTNRICFTLNVLTALLTVGRAGLVQHFANNRKGEELRNDTAQPQSQNMLQDLLMLLMEILLAEYSEKMAVNDKEMEANFRMKYAVCNCLHVLFTDFVNAIETANKNSSDSTGSSSFFLGLLYLCEVQKSVLLLLCELHEGMQNNESSSRETEPLLLSLLQVIGQIVVIESLCAVVSSCTSNHRLNIPKKHVNTLLQKRQFKKACPLTLQPLFYVLIISACQNSQFCYLDMLLQYMPYFDMTVLAPRILGAISKTLPPSGTTSSDAIHLLFIAVCITKFALENTLPCYTIKELQPKLSYIGVLHFFPLIEDNNDVASFNSDPSLSSSGTSGPISWFTSLWNQSKQTNNAPLCGRLQEKMLKELPQLYSAITVLWDCHETNTKDESGEPSISEDIRLLVKEVLVCPLTALPEAFLSTLAEMWMNWNSDEVENRRTNFISILHDVKIVELPALLDCTKKTLLLLGQMDDKDAGAVRQKYLLHFLYKFLSSSHQSADILVQCYPEILTFLKDCHQHLSHPESICLLTSILHVLVCRASSPVDKKTRRDLQETVYLLCVSLSMAAGVTTSHGYVWLQRNKVSVPHPLTMHSSDSAPSSPVRSFSPAFIKNSPSFVKEEEETPTPAPGGSSPPVSRETSAEAPSVAPSTSSSSATLSVPIHQQLQMPTIQALAVLSNVLSQFVDYVYNGKEQDKVISLLSAILYHVWPHLYDHSPERSLCYDHSLSLLTSLTEFPVARKSWKKDTTEYFLHPNFFSMSPTSVDSWLTIIDNLMAHDDGTMKNFLSKIRPASLQLMTNTQLTKMAGLLSRLAFVVFAGEFNQYKDHIYDIQDKLLECIASLVTLPQVLLCYQVMLLRFSPKSLQLIWPTVASESVRILQLLLKDLQQLATVQAVTSSEKGECSSSYSFSSVDQCMVYCRACHLVHTMLMMPTERLPQFQHVRWHFEDTADDGSNQSVMNGIIKLFNKIDMTLITPKQLATILRDVRLIVRTITTDHNQLLHLSDIEESLKLTFLTK